MQKSIPLCKIMYWHFFCDNKESLPEITVSKSSFDIKVRGHESFKVTISDNTWQITEVKVEDKKIADIGSCD